jgi:hypothetical protein
MGPKAFFALNNEPEFYTESAIIALHGIVYSSKNALSGVHTV